MFSEDIAIKKSTLLMIDAPWVFCFCFSDTLEVATTISFAWWISCYSQNKYTMKKEHFNKVLILRVTPQPWN